MADETASMITLTGTAMDAPDATQAAFAGADPGELIITENSAVGIYEATRDGVTVAGAVYSRTGDRVTLLATSVFPEFRGQGIAGMLLGAVLDRLRAEGATVILSCPFAAEFVAEHPEYAGVIAPGAPRHSH
jgi:predicted GNAT family acetyltransferase